MMGPVRIPPVEVWRAIVQGDNDLFHSVIYSIRMPRVAGAALAGWALGLAGLCYQSLLRNPLASEYTLGITTGAALGALSSALLGFTTGIWSAAFAFGGSIVTLALVFAMARFRTMDAHSLVLTGIILNAFGNALLSFLLAIISPNQLHSFLFWFLGSFAILQWPEIHLAAPIILAATCVILLMTWRMNAMSVNEELAHQIGIPVVRTKVILFLCSGLLTAVVVSFAGTIGFVGLVVPHIARLIVGADNRRLTWVVPIMGSTLCIFADLLSRVVLAPSELPVGVITAFLGVPIFLLLMQRRAA
jgi:iron complex transport system permease protein